MEGIKKAPEGAKEKQCKDNTFSSQSMAFESYETEWIKKYIEKLKKQFNNPKTPDFVKKELQSDIMKLNNEILPATQIGSSMNHYEIAKYADRAYENGIKFRCNGVIVYLPISNEYKERQKIGIVNCNDLPFGTDGAILLSGIEITNMDGSGTDNVESIILPLN